MRNNTGNSQSQCFSNNRNRHLTDTIPYILLSVISGIVFCNTLSNDFVFDDTETILNNNLIKDWDNITTIFSFNYFILSGEASYRPVVTLSNFIDYSLWGLKPMGFHLTNILLQIINTLLFYVILRRITKAYVGTFIAALFFTVHPLITETVNSISYREDLLAALFSLTAFLLFLHCESTASSERTYRLYYSTSLFSYFLALFSKEMAITLPVLLIIFHLCYTKPSGNFFRSLIRKVKGPYIGYLCITGFYLYIQFILFRNVCVTIDPRQGHIAVMPKVLASYIKLLFLPFSLNADYVVPPVNAGIFAFAISVFFLIATGIIILRLWKYHKSFCFFTVWFFITLLPVSNGISLENTMAERYLYIPFMGFVGSLTMVIQKGVSRNTVTRITFGIVLTIIGITGIYRNGIWRDECTLWYSTSKREPNSARAYHNLGVVHSAQGFYEFAEWAYKQTLKINPRDSEAHYNLGNVFKRRNLAEKALKEYQAAIQYNPYYSDAYNNLGNIFRERRDFHKAIEFYQKALRHNPFNPLYYSNLGLACGDGKRYPEAVSLLQKALAIKPDVPSTHVHLGNIYRDMGNHEEALHEYESAIRLDPNTSDAHNNKGIVFLNRGSYDAAVKAFEMAIQIDPQGSSIHNNLGITYAQSGNLDRAIEELHTAVALGFDTAGAHNNLAKAYTAKGLTERAIGELKQALRFTPEDSDTHSNLGNAYVSQGFFDEAIAEFKKAIVSNPADAEVYNFLGNALFKSGQYDKAREAFFQSIRYQAGNPFAHMMLGVMYSNYQNNPAKALIHLKESLRLAPRQPMSGQINEAIKKLEGEGVR
ncbi:MAG: tetratricopeptide repeat protein [Candidatus Brocadiaceae bacterium]|nr:tetratricopeptide repeat protein [Candidatus Brocadiaceae bacterium]